MKSTPTADLPISPLTPATATPAGGVRSQPMPVTMGPATSDKVVNDHDGVCSLDPQRTAQSYHTQEVQNPDGTITITSDNIHVTVRPTDGLQLPKDPVERQKALDAAYQSKSTDDQRAYGKTTAQIQQDALKGNDKDRYFDSEQHYVWALAASARSGGQIPPEYFMKLDPYGGTAGNGPDIQAGGGAGGALSTIAMAHDTDWSLGRYFNAGPLNALHGMQGVDPVHMGVVGLMGSGSAGIIGATQGDHPLTMSGDTATALDAAPKYVDSSPFNLSPDRANDWQVQYSRDYAKNAASNPFNIPLVDRTSFFRPEQLFDK